MRELCGKEQGIDVEAWLVGKTLYISCALDGLIGDDLDFQKEALEKLEGVMLSGTRASLSTDAKVDFLEVRVEDLRLGSSITLLRYVPDIKGLILLRYSRADFEDRLVLETGVSDDAKTSPPKDLTLSDFIARLTASRLQRQLTGNPLVSVFLQVRGVRGTAEDGVLTLSLDRAEKSSADTLSGDVLESAVADAALAVTKMYDPAGLLILEVRLMESDGKVISHTPLSDLKKTAQTKN